MRLEHKISKEFPSGAFIRLSTRSPKDGQPLDNKKIMTAYEEELKNLTEKWHPENWGLEAASEDLEANTKMAAMFRGTE